MSKTWVLVPIIAALSSTAALAGTPTRADLDARELRQYRAIEQGREDGSITWREGLKLRAEQRQIERTEAALAADGRLSRNDREYLRAMQDQAARDIHAEKNDGWYRWWWLPRFGR